MSQIELLPIQLAGTQSARSLESRPWLRNHVSNEKKGSYVKSLAAFAKRLYRASDKPLLKSYSKIDRKIIF